MEDRSSYASGYFGLQRSFHFIDLCDETLKNRVLPLVNLACNNCRGCNSHPLMHNTPKIGNLALHILDLAFELRIIQGYKHSLLVFAPFQHGVCIPLC